MSWDSDSLWSKSKIFMERAVKEERSGPLFPFWASLALELLARSSIAKISPVLLAEPDAKMNNVLSALGRNIGKGPAKSIATSHVFQLCRLLLPEYGDDQLKMCVALSERRNEELHSGGSPFEQFDTGIWIGGFYRAAKVLAESLGYKLEDFLGLDEASVANTLLVEIDKTILAKVKTSMSAHKTIFDEQQQDQQELLRATALADADNMAHHGGHRVKCPACGSDTYVEGEEISFHSPTVEDDLILLRAAMLPTKMTCKACGLSLDGHAELQAAGVGGQYTRTTWHDPVDYFGVYTDGPEAEYDNE